MQVPLVHTRCSGVQGLTNHTPRATRAPQVVVLGTASEPEVQQQWEEMAREYGRGGDARLVLRYD